MQTDPPDTLYVYRLPGSFAALKHRCWGDQCVVFAPEAGDTFLLTSTAWQVLTIICANAEGISFDQLLAGLGCSDHDEELTSLLGRTLEHFESQQLIKRLSA